MENWTLPLSIEHCLQENCCFLVLDTELQGRVVGGVKKGCHAEKVAVLTRSPDPPSFSFSSLLTSQKKAPSSFKATVSSWIFNKDDERTKN